MTSNALKLSQEKPLLGAVICCTSIAPEERARLAEYAQAMGAEHKLDLTSDVTHLIVGTTNTPKYAYVAREREDVRALRPEWIEAVRAQWMQARSIDMNALEAEYRVPTFAGLKICITGFLDLEFRAQLEKNVNENGGEYTGDLTKDVTHLIAHEANGKKYDYATSWGKKIVTLKWYQDTLERGMQLAESTYHPKIPVHEQGVGAWNRLRRQESMLGKRTREEQPSQEPTRKLRRTASAKFSSQANDVWSEIVSGGGSGPLADNNTRVKLRPSKSMPAIPQRDADLEDRLDEDKDRIDIVRPQTAGHPGGYLTGSYFVVQGFSGKQAQILSKIIPDAGAQILPSVAELLNHDMVNSSNSFVMVPYTTKQSAVPFFGKSKVKPNIVTELWLERCMIQKDFVSPESYPPGGIIEEVTMPDITSFTINATGFLPMETLHISKVVRLAGAQYSEAFTQEVSVLICKSSNKAHAKLAHAREWKVPVVTEEWLWKLLTTGQLASYENHGLDPADGEDDDLQQAIDRKRKDRQDKHRGFANGSQDFAERGDGFASNTVSKARTKSMHDSEMPRKTNYDISKGLRGTSRQGESHEESQQEISSRPSSSCHQSSRHPSTNGPLQDISPNSPTKRISQTRPKPQVPAFDGGRELKENMVESGDNVKVQEGSVDLEIQSPKRSRPDASSMNSAIQDLLSMKARAKAVAQAADQEQRGRGKKKLLGRALSNLSNSSRTSNPRQSRASSIDSLNTDGVGSEVGMPSANSMINNHTNTNRSNKSNNFALTGRAQPSSKSSSMPPVLPIDLSDPNLCRDEFADPDPAPQMTQLGYEDSEEAIALREKLAEKRRARTRLGQKDTDPPPEVAGHDRDQSARKQHDKVKRVLRDDDTVVALEAAGGWGGGRRTRNRAARDLEDEVLV